LLSDDVNHRKSVKGRLSLRGESHPAYAEMVVLEKGVASAQTARPWLTTRPHSRAQNVQAPLIGSIRRDCLDHVVVFGERHLRHLLESYQQYYNEACTYLALGKDAPVSRAVQTVGSIVAKPLLGGLHHQCVRI
jgi:hypothetical protein